MKKINKNLMEKYNEISLGDVFDVLVENTNEYRKGYALLNIYTGKLEGASLMPNEWLSDGDKYIILGEMDFYDLKKFDWQTYEELYDEYAYITEGIDPYIDNEEKEKVIREIEENDPDLFRKIEKSTRKANIEAYCASDNETDSWFVDPYEVEQEIKRTLEYSKEQELKN